MYTEAQDKDAEVSGGGDRSAICISVVIVRIGDCLFP